jgi:uncharacterized membrane protein
MTLESSKNLGGIGAILIVIGMLGFAVPYAGILLLIGLILLLIGLKGLADYYKEGGIFNNTLYAIILAIVGVVVAVGTFIVTALAALSDIIGRTIDLSNVTDWTTLGTELTNRFTNFADFSAIWTLIGAFVVALIIIFVFAIVAVFFFRRSLNQLSSKTGVGMFGTAGLLMLIGAVLTIVVIGILLIWIAWILVAVAFFQIRSQAAAPPPPPTPPQ